MTDTREIRALADELRGIAKRLDAVADAEQVASVERWTAALAQIAAEVAAGGDKTIAIHRAAYDHQLDIGRLGLTWAIGPQRRMAEKRRMLPLRIADLTSAGIKDAEIARIVGVHPKSVPRIRRRMREKQEGK